MERIERAPLGVLLQQVTDLEGDIGIAYERSCDFLKERHAHDRPQLTFPRGATELEVQVFTRKAQTTHRLNSSQFLLLPVGVEHVAASRSAIYDVFTLYPRAQLLNRTCAAFSPSG